MESTTRREFLKLLALGSGATLLAACSQPSQPAPTLAPAKPAVPTQAAPPQAAPPTQPPPSQAVATQPAAPAAQAVPVRDVSFVVADGTEPNSLDPSQGTGPFQHIINAIYDGLVAWNEKMELIPALATSWEVSPDGSVWTFKLRQGVKFHDGSSFTSEAVKVTLEHILDKEMAVSRGGSYQLIKKIETPDPYTARITTDPPNPDIPFLMGDNTAKIISPAAMAKYGKKDLGRNPVGTGPFKFEEWIANDHVSATIFADYWGPKPQVRRFVMKVIPEAAARVVTLKTGEADVVFNLPTADVENLRKDTNVVVQVAPSVTIVEAEPRQSVAPFSDKRVRWALNLAIDRDAIIKGIMNGMALPLNTPSIPGIWGTFEFDPIPYDPDRAKQMLAEAGYPNGIDITLQTVSGRWAGDDQVCEALQGYWTRVGIRTTLKKITMADLMTVISGDPDTLPGQVVFLLKTSEFQDYHLTMMYYSPATHSNNAQHYAYGNPEVDKLIDLERRTFDPQKRLELFKQVQKLIWDDMPLVYIFHRPLVWGQRKNVSGFRVLPNNRIVPLELQKS